MIAFASISCQNSIRSFQREFSQHISGPKKEDFAQTWYSTEEYELFCEEPVPLSNLPKIGPCANISHTKYVKIGLSGCTIAIRYIFEGIDLRNKQLTL